MFEKEEKEGVEREVGDERHTYHAALRTHDAHARHARAGVDHSSSTRESKGYIYNTITLTTMPQSLICPSLLSADFSHLAEEAKKMTDAGADYLHMDVMVYHPYHHPHHHPHSLFITTFHNNHNSPHYATMQTTVFVQHKYI